MRFWILFLIMFCLSFGQALMAKGSDSFKLTQELLQWLEQEQAPLVEGFKHKISGQELEYSSFLPNVDRAMITRATDGTMAIEWQSAPLPAVKGGKVLLVWTAGLGVNLGQQPFDLYLNDRYVLTFFSKASPQWQVSGEGGTQLRFLTGLVDQFGDHFGPMILSIPAGMYESGKALKIKVVGQAAQSQAWYMTFLFSELAQRLQRLKKEGFYYTLSIDQSQKTGRLRFLGSFHPDNFQLKDANKQVALMARNSEGELIFQIEKLNLDKSLQLFDDKQLIDQIDLNQSEEVFFFENGKTVEHRVQLRENKIHFNSCAHFFTALAVELKNLSKTKLSKGKVLLVSSSHQDIAWMESPQNCIIQRDTMVLSPAFEMLANNKDYAYSAEDALMLREYLQRQPQRLEEIRKYVRQGRLEWGATYNQPYEGMWYGESLLRQLYLGRRWLKQVLPGYEPRVAFNVDVPARTLQMAQILKKSGVDYLVISRHQKGFFYWQSPDGSRIGVYSPGHYHWNSQIFREGPNAILMRAPRFLSDWSKKLERVKVKPVLPVLYSTDMNRPKNFEPFRKKWHNVQLLDENWQPQVVRLPEFHYATMQKALDALFNDASDLPVIEGERPNVWLYIHGPAHHHALDAIRQGARLLTTAETFASMRALLFNDWQTYPKKELELAWQNHIYSDHGWGGKNGHITDQQFLDKARFAHQLARDILNKQLKQIASAIKFNKHQGQPIVVFNTLPYSRSTVCTFRKKIALGQKLTFKLFDENGRSVALQKVRQQLSPQGDSLEVAWTFQANQVPGIGFRTFYLKTESTDETTARKRTQAVIDYENQYYWLEFARGGLKQIYDKELKKNLFDTEKFLAGELFTMHSEGNGAGEFAEVQQPTMEAFDRLSNYQAFWRLTDDGPLFSDFVLEREMPHVTVRYRLRVFKQEKRIDFDLDLLNWDGTPYREYRLAFPLAMEDARVTYEVPFGRVTVGQDEIPGAAGERYVQPAAEVRPREVLDWISASNGQVAVTFSSSVAVWDYRDPTEKPLPGVILQPILIASRKSCHWEGNWYLQKGNHHFHFSLTSHRGDWRNGFAQARSVKRPLLAVIPPPGGNKKILPPTFSFFSLNNKGLLLSTIKKAGDRNALIVRVFDMFGQKQTLDFALFKKPQNVFQTNLIEEKAHKVKKLRIGAFSVETFEFQF